MIIELIIIAPMTIGLVNPRSPALLNAYNINPNPIVEYITERLSSLVYFTSL
ncbi:hypothetical protein [Staphylococcus aureus]|uniref:hypothetical protein n=1 Tax=Staphylococcus aureus TaxID=1280 RepID=UPI001A8E3A96|nr:hypothetical protein [Staphylococcus aureus]